ncbi:putative MFS transporter, AGZA family, xanthine/uracil permease [Faecalicatena contorta]|uniref:Putative MFS transporter, AGZA family, xanthine/uracil permease n=2 Tax=Faecalicatena contorta TaxID=39482 RepID=A0A315ZUA3_9FIRM|nr:NCS2 family permease [Faecalicatena contorta]PWJ49075.1 AGZA family xanthine/uracil permease-like MFS transporter [Faecalicatena contorta]SUQ14780.1 putative MFS transporter, AGZA family, xanthine/uracil permease [Faecalicatena contorta]
MNKESESKTTFLDNYFGITENKSTMRTEILAGLTTFITIAYILILNPQILADPYMIMGDAVMAGKIANGVFIGTCIGAFIGTILCAIYAKVPFAQAPGMGLNAFFAYTVVLGMGYTYGQALVIVFLSGVFFIVITAVGLREAIIRSIPDAVKTAITPGIGLFITIIGLKNSGLVVGNSATLVSMVDFAQWRNPDVDLTPMMGALVALIGLIIMGVLHAKKVKGSILIGIVASTIIGIPLGVTHLSNFSLDIGTKFSDFAEVSFMKMDFSGLFQGGNVMNTIFTVTMLVISFSLVNMFDSIGTLLGAAKQSGMIDENGEVIRMKQALMSDAISTATGAMVGTSTVTTVVESSAGIAEGGRTGMTSFVTALLFLGAIIFAPIVGIVPGAATAPALIFVGILMLSNVKDVDFSDMTNALPAFCTIVFMPFTYSIANGVALGLITFCLMKICSKKFEEVKVLTLVISIVFVIRYIFMTLG